MTRQLIFSLCALVLTCTTYAQSHPWSPIIPHDVTYFHNGTAPSQGIYIDSTTVNGDTLHHYIRPLLFAAGNDPFDYCADWYPGFDSVYAYEGYDTLYVYKYSFLGSEVLELPNSQWAVVNGDTSLLDMSAAIGESWDFQSTGNETIQATLVSAEAGLVLGVEDSIKTIALSSGDSVLISRNHGLVYWPSADTTAGFSLIGITLEELGNHPPSPREVFDFQVGDVFCYVNFDGGGGSYGTSISRIQVVDKQVVGDNSIQYNTMAEFFSRITDVGNQGFPNQTTTIFSGSDLSTFLIDFDQSAAQTFLFPPNSIVGEAEYDWNSNLILNPSAATFTYNMANYDKFPILRTENNNVETYFKGINAAFHPVIISYAEEIISTNDFDSNMPDLMIFESLWEESDIIGDTVKSECTSFFNEIPLYSYSENLGVTSLAFPSWYGFRQVLIGFTNGTDTLGYVPPPGVLSTLSTTEREGIPKLAVYPNPTSEFIRLEGLLDGVYQIDIYSASGVLMLQKNLNGSAQLNVKGLAQGMYYGTAQTQMGDRAIFQFMVQ